MNRLFVLLIGIWLLQGAAFAQTPAAIVEEVSGASSGLEFMDYVETGKVIQLGPSDSIVLSYLSSCVLETIHGGAVRVGVDQSEMVSGVIERTKADCDAANMLNAKGQSIDSASLIIRSNGNRTIKPAPTPTPAFTIYGLSPVFDLGSGGALVVARLDQKGEYFTLRIDPKQLLHGTFLDFAAEGKSLTAGGVYGVRWSGRLTVFKVAPTAARGPTSLAGRLVKLKSAG